MSADIGKGDWVMALDDLFAGPKKGSVHCVESVVSVPGSTCGCHDGNDGGLTLVGVQAPWPAVGWCVLCFSKLGGPRQAEPRLREVPAEWFEPAT